MDFNAFDLFSISKKASFREKYCKRLKTIGLNSEFTLKFTVHSSLFQAVSQEIQLLFHAFHHFLYSFYFIFDSVGILFQSQFFGF